MDSKGVRRSCDNPPLTQTFRYRQSLHLSSGTGEPDRPPFGGRTRVYRARTAAATSRLNVAKAWLIAAVSDS